MRRHELSDEEWAVIEPLLPKNSRGVERVEEPMLSMVAIIRNAFKRSGASVPNARHAPLNSSISATRVSISGVICMVSVLIIPD